VSFDGEALRTRRLILRRWRAEDAAPMTAINSDPEVTPLLNRRMDAEAVATFPERTARHWAEHGFGHWAVEPIVGPSTGEMRPSPPATMPSTASACPP
jgi:ribosomal-protein-alanine N-acetyltransferase